VGRRDEEMQMRSWRFDVCHLVEYFCSADINVLVFCCCMMRLTSEPSQMRSSPPRLLLLPQAYCHPRAQ
jgi:hypothetical protein